MQKLDYYFFLTADPNPNGTGGDKNRYVSQFIYYAGYESCGKDYDFEKKAREAFEKYIMAEYPSVKNLRIIVESKKNGSYKIKTKQEAQTKLNSWIADEERTNDHKVVKTMFSFSCE